MRRWGWGGGELVIDMHSQNEGGERGRVYGFLGVQQGQSVDCFCVGEEMLVGCFSVNGGGGSVWDRVCKWIVSVWDRMYECVISVWERVWVDCFRLG